MIPLAVNHPNGVRTINSSLFFIYFGESLGIIYPLNFILFICLRDVLLTEIELYRLLHILRIRKLKFTFSYSSTPLHTRLKFIKKQILETRTDVYISYIGLLVFS